ncbi:hypothetical protein BER93_00355 [Xanthomonas fragariae]|nr:hypothetical protein BER92_00350 [Xanthomonas fragariae]AOD16869.1 hypothetical protein BER93_00355 [Xanthomonas fragariae]
MRLSLRKQQRSSLLLKTLQFMKNVRRQLIVHQPLAVSAKSRFHAAPGRQMPIYPIQPIRNSSRVF